MVAPTDPANRRTAGRSPHLALEGVTVDRGRRRVLEGLSFEIDRGEIFGLLGPNGACKSTAFHVLTGLLPARSGRVVLDGTPELVLGEDELKQGQVTIKHLRDDSPQEQVSLDNLESWLNHWLAC